MREHTGEQVWTMRSVDDTQRLAESLARCLKAGDVVALDGDLGAGKTHFVQGIARGLEIEEPVTSPTFNIINEYRSGVLPLFHVDLYRLEQPEDLEDIGFFELVDETSEGASFVEWAGKFEDEMPEDHLSIQITVMPGENTRELRVLANGLRSDALLAAWIDRWDN